MMKLTLKSFVILLLIFFTYSSVAQSDDAKPNDKVEILLKDGNRIIGKIKSISATDFIIISESLGEITIKKENITQITFTDVEPAMPDKNGFITDYHNSTHYSVNPSGYGLKAGQKYYENIAVFFNTFSFGVTDNFTVAVGGEVASLLFASRFPILYISSKLSIPFQDESGAIGITGLLFTSPSDEFEGFGVIQGNVTIGSRNNNFTAGLGLGFGLQAGFTDEVIPLQLSYMTRISQKISFITDNFVIFYNDFDRNEGVISAGIRLHFKKNGGALNVSLWRLTEGMGDVFALPFVSATIPMGE